MRARLPSGKRAIAASRLRAEQELDLAELVRLKPARRLEPGAEGQELERRHRLEDVELRDHHLQDRQDPLQRVLRAMRSSWSSSAHHAIELVQQLLEPQLVDLVNDDEEHLVVLGPVGTRLLQRQRAQSEPQIIAVRNGGVGMVGHHATPLRVKTHPVAGQSLREAEARARVEQMQAPCVQSESDDLIGGNGGVRGDNDSEQLLGQPLDT